MSKKGSVGVENYQQKSTRLRYHCRYCNLKTSEWVDYKDHECGFNRELKKKSLEFIDHG